MPETDEQKAFKKTQEDVRKAREMLKTLEKLGVEVPKELTKKLNTLQKALDAAEDVADAATEASEALNEYQQTLVDACKKMGDEDAMVCEARVARQWQAHAVKFTLDIEDKSSVVAKSIQKTVARYTPKVICKNFDYCAKEAEKAEKKKK
jgi:conjugal transfer/entry exclusion protein